VTFPAARFGCETEQPQHEGCEQGDEKQHLEARGTFGLSVSQSEPPSVTFEVTEGFFDFHTACVRPLDEIARAAMMWKRGGEQRWSAMQSPIELIVGRIEFAFAGSAGAALVGAHEIEAKLVAVSG